MRKIKKYKAKIVRLIAKGSDRSRTAKKNIIISFLLKGISIFISLIYVPLLINYLGVEEYGVWLTISSIIGWFSFFDIGLGNGLRNKLTEAFAKNNNILAKEYISTTYAIVSIVFGATLILFYFVNPFLNWVKILNTSTVDKDKLTLLAQIIFTFFSLRFIFQLIGNIYQAKQLPAINDAIGPIGNIICLVVIYILIKTTNGSLIMLGFVLSSVPVLILIIMTLIAFNVFFKDLRPSIKSINFRHSKYLLSLGFKFFIIQVAALVLFSTSNIIISQILSPAEVTQYNIAYKYFSITFMVITIILSPIWSAVTDAYTREDYNWLRSTLNKLNKIGILFLLVAIIQYILSDFFYKIWVGSTISIPVELSLALLFDTAWTCFSAPYNNYINGFGKLKLGLYIVTFRLITFIPLAIYLTQSIGISGIVWASLIGKLFTVFNIIQVNKIINKKAYGIWNK